MNHVYTHLLLNDFELLSHTLDVFNFSQILHRKLSVTILGSFIGTPEPSPKVSMAGLWLSPTPKLSLRNCTPNLLDLPVKEKVHWKYTVL